MLRNFLVDIRKSVSDMSELCVIARRFPSPFSFANTIGYRIPILDEKILLLRVCYAPTNGIA